MSAPATILKGLSRDERATIDYWSQWHPFLSTKQTFGRIEAITALDDALGVALLVRGWIFTTLGDLSDLTVMSRPSEIAFTVHSLERLDVLVNFRRFPQSRFSGFISRFAPVPRNPLPQSIQLNGSCISGDTELHFMFEQERVSYGVTQLGHHISPPSSLLSSDRPILATVLLSGAPVHGDFVPALANYASRKELQLAVFSDHSPGELDALSSSPTWRSRVQSPTNSLASTLWGHRERAQRIIILGAIERSFISEQLGTLMATPPAPPISWVVRPDTAIRLPLELCGHGTQIVETKGNWIQRALQESKTLSLTS